jgi:hypothetical protein
MSLSFISISNVLIMFVVDDDYFAAAVWDEGEIERWFGV